MSSAECRRRWRHSLRGTLGLHLGLTVAVAMGGLFAVIDYLVDAELYRRFDAGLASRAQALTAYLGAPGAGKRPPIEALLPQFNSQGHTDFYQVWDGRGAVLARSASSHGRDLVRPAQASANGAYYDLDLPDGHRGRALARVVPLPAEDPRGALLVVVAEEREALDALERRLHRILLTGTGGALLLVLLLTAWSLRRALAPLDAFGRAVAELPLDGSARPPPGDDLPSELAPVAGKLAATLERLLAALDRERRFSRDLAHELRTPLAEARLLAELAAREPGAVSGNLAPLGAALADMADIVDGLLYLARVEAGSERPQPDPLDLAALLAAQAERCRAPAAARDLGWELHTEPCWVLADAALLGRLLAILCDNAVQHAPPGDRLLAHCTCNPPGLWLDNAAPQLAADDLPRLDERFFHRAKGDHAAHAGLGLALARALAEVLGLELSFALVAGRLRVTLGGFAPLPADAPSA
jgi:two-component system sensor histidine kinase QseC